MGIPEPAQRPKHEDVSGSEDFGIHGPVSDPIARAKRGPHGNPFDEGIKKSGLGPGAQGTAVQLVRQLEVKVLADAGFRAAFRSRRGRA
jgi:hypothetical protein